MLGGFMKFFIDSANISEIKEALSLGMCDGVTTNPSLVARKKPFNDVVKRSWKPCPVPWPRRGGGLDAAGMVAEAKKLVELGGNVVIKVPLTTEGLKATKILSGEGIDVNETLIFSPVQALMAKAGAAYVSPFVGRLDGLWPRTAWNWWNKSSAFSTTTVLQRRSSWPACAAPCTSSRRPCWAPTSPRSPLA